MFCVDLGTNTNDCCVFCIVKKIESMGRVFDPNFERVVQEVEDKTKPAGTVIAELQSAYTINERILREAMVVVSKGGK